MSSPFPWTCCLLQDWLLACNVFLMLLSTLLGHCQLKGEEREGVSRVSDSQTYSFFRSVFSSSLANSIVQCLSNRHLLLSPSASRSSWPSFTGFLLDLFPLDLLLIPLVQSLRDWILPCP